MGKSRHSKQSYRLLDRDYDDGDEYRQEHRNKSKDRRIQRALKTKNVREMLEINEDYDHADIQFHKYY